MGRLLVLALASCAAAVPAPSHSSDFVEVASVISDAVIDLRYATADNFTHMQLYPIARCRLHRAVAERLARAAATLRAQHRRLLLWDCYRPRSIQYELWRHVPDERYVANPAQGSRHNRGAAVDVALVADDGSPVPLPTKFDDFSEAAHRDHALAGDAGAEARRLQDSMSELLAFSANSSERAAKDQISVWLRWQAPRCRAPRKGRAAEREAQAAAALAAERASARHAARRTRGRAAAHAQDVPGDSLGDDRTRE